MSNQESVAEREEFEDTVAFGTVVYADHDDMQEATVELISLPGYDPERDVQVPAAAIVVNVGTVRLTAHLDHADLQAFARAAERALERDDFPQADGDDDDRELPALVDPGPEARGIVRDVVEDRLSGNVEAVEAESVAVEVDRPVAEVLFVLEAMRDADRLRREFVDDDPLPIYVDREIGDTGGP